MKKVLLVALLATSMTAQASTPMIDLTNQFVSDVDLFSTNQLTSVQSTDVKAQSQAVVESITQNVAFNAPRMPASTAIAPSINLNQMCPVINAASGALQGTTFGISLGGGTSINEVCFLWMMVNSTTEEPEKSKYSAALKRKSCEIDAYRDVERTFCDAYLSRRKDDETALSDVNYIQR